VAGELIIFFISPFFLLLLGLPLGADHKFWYI